MGIMLVLFMLMCFMFVVRLYVLGFWGKVFLGFHHESFPGGLKIITITTHKLVKLLSISLIFLVGGMLKTFGLFLRVMEILMISIFLLRRTLGVSSLGLSLLVVQLMSMGYC